MNIRAYCPTCKRFVSDDIMETGTGVKNEHEHVVKIMNDIAQLRPNESLEGVVELTPSAYLNEVSKIDADLIVTKLSRSFSLPIPRPIMRGIVEEVLKLSRHIVVDDLKKPPKARKKKEPEVEILDR